MTTRFRLLLSVSCLGLVVAFGTAAAQTTGVGPGAAPAGKVEVGAGTAVTPAEQSAAANSYIVKMENASKRVRHLLDEARRNKDVVKVTCLSDKLNQITVAVKSANERSAALKAAIARGDTDVRNHEFQVLVVLKTRADQVDAEANQCIGEELGFPGETKTTYSIDPNIAPEDPGTGDTTTVTLVPPLPASPIN